MRLKHSAFSLLEMVIYLGIMSMVLISITLFSFKLISVQSDGRSKLDLNENSRVVLQTFTKIMRDAESLNSVTDGTPLGTLELITDDGSTLRLDTTTKVVGARTIRLIQLDPDISDGTAAVAITDDTVNVTDFVFNQLTRVDGETESIQLEFTLESIDESEDGSFRTTMTLREQNA